MDPSTALRERVLRKEHSDGEYADGEYEQSGRGIEHLTQRRRGRGDPSISVGI